MALQQALLPVSRRKRISLTALIDVVFILLLFFMLTSTFNRWKAVDLQSPVASNAQPGEIKPTLVMLRRNGALSFVNPVLELSHFAKLAEIQPGAIETTSPIVLMPEASVPVQTIISALEQFKSVGWTKVSLGDVIPATGDQ